MFFGTTRYSAWFAPSPRQATRSPGADALHGDPADDLWGQRLSILSGFVD